MFDDVIMVDWSAAGAPKQGADSIWIAVGAAGGGIQLSNPPTRQAALESLRDVLHDRVARGRRVLIGLDFAYGYPAGFAQVLGAAQGGDEPAWRTVWHTIHDAAMDPLVGGGDGGNTLSQFAIAEALNVQLAPAHQAAVIGPFWGRSDWTLMTVTLNQLPEAVREAAPFARGLRAGGGALRRQMCAELCIQAPDLPHLPMTSPGFPFHVGGHALPRLRHTERRGHGAQETWKVYGAGSVGGQSLTGIPYLWELLTDAALAPHSRVWPFTTGFMNPALDASCGPLVVHAEIFPNAVPPAQYAAAIPADLPDVNDARQVWALAHHALHLDAGGQLEAAFAEPVGVEQGALAVATEEEGWILFS